MLSDRKNMFSTRKNWKMREPAGLEICIPFFRDFSLIFLKIKEIFFFSNKNLYYSVNLNLNRSMNSLYPMDCIFHLNTNLGVIHKRGHHLLKRFLNPTLYPSRPVLLQNTISSIKNHHLAAPSLLWLLTSFMDCPLQKGELSTRL